MATIKWRTECTVGGKDSDNAKKLNGRCEDVTEADKENQVYAETQVVLVL